MLRWIFLIALLGIGTPCFSEQIAQGAHETNLHDEGLALVYVGCGNENLLSHNYVAALEDFGRASSLLKKLEQPCPELEFLIFFGKAIAYDNLELKNECQNALVSLFLILNDGEGMDDESETNGSDVQARAEYEEADQIMKRLAMQAPTFSVRSLLLSVVDEMSEHLLPLFKIASPAPLGQNDWQYDNNYAISGELCKSHWRKRMEQIAKRIYTFVIKAKEVWDFIKEIDETIRRG